MPPPAFEDPRFDLPLLGVGGVRLAVVEDDRAAVAAGQHQRLEGGLMGRDTGFQGAVRLPGVIVRPVAGQRHTGRAQLLERAAGGARQPGLLPDLRGQPQCGGLLGVQRDRGQAVAVAAGEIADVALDALDGLDDQAELAQIVLVALEHAVERVVAARLDIGLDGRPAVHAWSAGAVSPAGTAPGSSAARPWQSPSTPFLVVLPIVDRTARGGQGKSRGPAPSGAGPRTRQQRSRTATGTGLRRRPGRRRRSASRPG